MLALALLALSASAQPRVSVCANLPIERLPAGTALGISDAFLTKARDEISRERSPMERSPYQTHQFSVVFDSRISWADGSQVAVSCALSATLHQVELRHFSVLSAVVKPMKPMTDAEGRPLSQAWMKYVYDLDDGEIRFPASLTCESEPARVDKDRPFAALEKTRLSVGALENILFPSLPLQITTQNCP